MFDWIVVYEVVVCICDVDIVVINKVWFDVMVFVGVW